METVSHPVMVIELVDSHGRCLSQHRVIGAGTIYKIGRSLTCDIVVDDAYAAAEHTSLTLRDDGRVTVTDLDSRNGTRVDSQRVNAAAITIESGQLIIGRTLVRIRTAHAALAPEKLFRRDIFQRHRTLFAVFGLALSLFYVAFAEWQEAPDQLARDISIAVLAASILFGVWVGFWALITRVSHGAWALRTHLAIIANATALIVWSVLLFDMAAFVTQWSWLATLPGLVVVCATLGALYLHLRKATHLARRIAAIISVAIPLALGGTAAWIGWQGTTRNVNRIALGTNIYPPQVRLAPNKELNDFLAQTSRLKREASRNRQVSLAERPIAATKK